MRKFNITVNGITYAVDVEEVSDGAVNTTPVVPAPSVAPKVVSAPAAVPAVQPEVQQASGATGSVKVEAPMPGTVLKINVNVGDTVTEGQALVILEAMKMENEIASPKSGTVASVNVSQGNSVNTGDLLITLN